ncbi:hypothetical protein F511_35454 [Dorcoceras hygrometricum]|uniref:Uncharacterized protein n=1 Tax=Dorcoceras hygrometricum TaxID=472368 RepID=A0A2Z7CD05_9LAMI|nr:hypothetical protein F511_35454 [Dorcoceras hygrometricum]
MLKMEGDVGDLSEICMLRCVLVCLREFSRVGGETVSFWVLVKSGVAGVNVHPNPISVDCRRFSSPFGARLAALSSSSLGLSIDTSLETGVAGFEEHEFVVEFVFLHDCGPVACLFFNRFGVSDSLPIKFLMRAE